MEVKDTTPSATPQTSFESGLVSLAEYALTTKQYFWPAVRPVSPTVVVFPASTFSGWTPGAVP